MLCTTFEKQALDARFSYAFDNTILCIVIWL